MPFRIIGYDGATYRSQLQQERKKMLPVVTIVLYFGTDRHWNSRKKIKELMEIPVCVLIQESVLIIIIRHLDMVDIVCQKIQNSFLQIMRMFHRI